VAYIKGAVERLLAQTGSVFRNGRAVPITQDDIQTFMAANQEMAQEAMRVIALAYADFHHSHEGLKEEDLRGKLVLVGLVGMADPPREEVKLAIRQCHEAGIRVVMVTGDHKVTAEAIGRELDLPKGEAVTGAELAKMSNDELCKEIENISVFARIEPLHKLRIVNALKSRGEVVAMTGDGVNDAPALKAASIGIAMGITGTDVAKEAADMVLADDNFASVVAAVEEGRAIFNRLRNNVFFLLSTNLGELIGLTLSVLFVGQVPMLPVQIIWNNLATDTAVDIPLGLEPKIGNELQQPPRHPRVGLLFPGMLFRILFMATLMGVGIFLVFNWAQATRSIQEARTITFCTMVTFEWFRAFNARSDEIIAFRLGLFRNKWLIISISVVVLLQMAVIYVPALQAAFKTVPLGWEDWGIILLAGGSLFAIDELRKVFFPRLFSWGKWQPVNEESKYEV
jgi:Ca2+-transporting ATPase